MQTISEMRQKFIKKDFIVDNLMKSNGIYCLVARPKVGKSLLALQLANSIATGTKFLGLETNSSPVLYISTEMDYIQLLNRIDKMNLQFNDENFHFIEQEPNERRLNLMDLEIQLKKFSEDYKGKFIIVDMFSGIDVNYNFDINNYQDIGQNVIPKYRELCQKYNFTILLIHHLNKNNTSLGSTAIDGSVDGKITLRQDSNLKNKIFLDYESRDYEGFNIVIERTNNLNFEVSGIECEDLSTHIIAFLNYAISKKEFQFFCGDVTSDLKLPMLPSTFGKLLNNNLKVLEKEGLYISSKKTSKGKLYTAKYEEPTDKNE